MPIYAPTGFLDVTNATLRGSKIVTTSNVGVANVNPLNTLSVGSNLQVEDTGSNVLTIRGNAAAAAMTLGLITIAPSYSLEVVSNIGNTVSNTIQFTNETTGFVSDSNIEVGTGNLFVNTSTGLVSVGNALSVNGRADLTDLHASNLTVDGALYANASTGRVGINTTSPGDFNLDVHGTANVGALTATDVIVTGNLAVAGEFASVRSTTVNVDDPIIGLANNNTSDPAVLDIGFVMARPSTATGSNVAIIFDESSDTLEIGYTTGKHTDTTITIDDSAIFHTNIHGNVAVSNLEVGQFSVVAAYGLDHVTNENNSTGDTIISTNGTTGLQTTANVSVGRDALVSGNVEVSKELTVSGNVEVSKELTVTGNVEVGTANLFVDTTTSNVGIGTTNPRATLDINATDALIVPNGTTSERPTGIEGMFRYNSTTNYFEMYINSGWMSVLPASPPSGIVSVSPSSIAYANVTTEDITVTGSSFDSNCVVTLEGFDGTTYNTSNFTLNSDSEITFRIGTLAPGQAENRPYRVLLTNESGITTRSAQTLRFDEGPTWSSPASQSTHYFGTIGTNTITLSATDVTGGSSVRYSVVGSLPGGLTLSGNTISGTSTESDGTTSTVTIRATDTVDTFRYTDLVFTIETQDALFEFTSHTFDQGRLAGGQNGPTLAQCQSAYNVTWDTNSNYFTVTGGIQQWTVPATGMYEIDAYGATGGYRFDSSYNISQYGGKGARIKGTFSLTRGDIIQILVGQMGHSGSTTYSGGGGGTFVYKPADGLTDGLLIAAGGGGGSYYAIGRQGDICNANIHENGKSGYSTSGGVGGTNGYGGGGYSSNSGGGAGWKGDGGDGRASSGGHSFANGGSGGSGYSVSYNGGFGGGGAADGGFPGGGGGYSGGGGSVGSGVGGGGGSYISSLAIDVLKEVNYSVDIGNGKVNIKLL